MICITSWLSVGCTFLDWSIHFLSGQTDFFKVNLVTDHSDYIPLSLNPLDKTNAHGHKKNHPSGSLKSQSTIKHLQKQPGLTSFYPFPLHLEQVAKHLGIDINTMTQQQWQSIRDYQVLDYNQLLRESHASGAKIVVVAVDEQIPLYLLTTRSLDRMPFEPRAAKSSDDMKQQIDQVFFSDSTNTWHTLNLTNTWDQRERQALCSRPFDTQKPKIALPFAHYWLHCQSWWYNGHEEITKIMSWLQLPVIPERSRAWLPIYRDWQQVQINAMQFQHNYKHIVDSVVNNWFYNIDLTFDQEVVIQHCLIYQHGLNLKTWQLEKFPSNTQDLHKLLEPNIHPVTDIYARLATQVC